MAGQIAYTQTNAPLKPYEYVPLESQSDQIRLLQIPRKTNDTGSSVHYRLAHASLQDNPGFEALSYCWGNADLSHETTVDGQVMRITQSLVTALASIQSKDRDIVLWADAVCINQKDDVEKSAQVQLMQFIYKSASRVIIWLGPSNPAALNTIQEMQKWGETLISSGFWQITWDDMTNWKTEGEDITSWTTSKRAIAKLSVEHLAQAIRGQHRFPWIMSDFEDREWFRVGHVRLYGAVVKLTITAIESLVHIIVRQCTYRVFPVRRA